MIYLTGYMISALILFIALVSFTCWIVSLTKDPEQRESYYIIPEGNMPMQKIFAVFTFGHAIIISWIKNVTFQVNLQPKLKTDTCGHFGYFSESKVIIFTANGSTNPDHIENYNRLLKGYNLPIHSNASKLQIIDKTPFYLSPASSYVQSGEFFWIIG